MIQGRSQVYEQPVLDEGGMKKVAPRGTRTWW